MKKTPQMRGRARLECELDVETKANFVALCATCEVNMTDLIKKSVALFDLAVSHRKAGGQLIFRHKDGREERLVVL
jgi:hypothetical protein